MTTSASRMDRAIEQRGSRATLRLFRVPAPVWNQKAPSSQMAPTAVTCGLPSSLTVVSHFVRALCASGSGAEPSSSFSTTAVQLTGGRPSSTPRLMTSMTPLLSCAHGGRRYVIVETGDEHQSHRRPAPVIVDRELRTLRP